MTHLRFRKETNLVRYKFERFAEIFFSVFPLTVFCIKLISKWVTDGTKNNGFLGKSKRTDWNNNNNNWFSTEFNKLLDCNFISCMGYIDYCYCSMTDSVVLTVNRKWPWFEKYNRKHKQPNTCYMWLRIAIFFLSCSVRFHCVLLSARQQQQQKKELWREIEMKIKIEEKERTKKRNHRTIEERKW